MVDHDPHWVRCPRHVARVTAADILCRRRVVTICPRVDGDPDPHPLDLEKT